MKPAAQPQVPKLTLIEGRGSPETRFAALVQPHYDVLYRVAYRFTRSVHDAEDLAQEVCVRAYPRLAELEQLEQPRGWLLRVLYRLFVDSVRRYERRHVASIDDIDADELVCERPGPVEETERALDRRRLSRAWQHLDQEQRALLALHDVEGYSLAELKELTGLKDGTLKSRLHRARVRLGRLLQRETTAADGPGS
ncbi:MAG TPA: RNA polymerase sigma factor [Gammaproteobacteria bacterium]|nr:RNA polymerase sigma factor [Gammaproteobacteria bacterium]